MPVSSQIFDHNFLTTYPSNIWFAPWFLVQFYGIHSEYFNYHLNTLLKITKLLCYMYANQEECSVRWGSEHSDFFNVSNGVKQGGAISPILFSCYIDKLSSRLEHSGLRCHVGSSYAGAFGYAEDQGM